jgi:hypothetical protein
MGNAPPVVLLRYVKTSALLTISHRASTAIFQGCELTKRTDEPTPNEINDTMCPSEILEALQHLPFRRAAQRCTRFGLAAVGSRLSRLSD